MIKEHSLDLFVEDNRSTRKAGGRSHEALSSADRHYYNKNGLCDTGHGDLRTTFNF